MSLSDLASIASLASGVAVLVSLIYLNLQVRQAERIQQSSIRDSRATRIVDIVMGSTEASLAEAIAKCGRGDADASETQVRQYFNYWNARLINTEESFYQHKEGLLNDVAFNQLEKRLRAGFSVPGSRAVYSRIRLAFGDDFVAYVDKIVATVPVGFGRDTFSDFKSDVAAEMAKIST